MKFRQDINGLRAIAVLAVVLFHFEPELIQGGFVGVDIFFVISGFLMTRIVLTKLDAKTFSITSFYVSRANRIIPALLVLVLLLTIVLPLVIPIPDYLEFTKRAVSAVLFVSNNYFYSQGGYFEANSQFNWLLHTWSLSVEWQFYLLFPIIVVALNRFMTTNKFIWCFLIAIIASFALGIFYSYTNSSFGYFMLVTRAWELLAGGVVYFLSLKNSEERSKFTEYLGLLLILGSVFFVNEATPWPGYIAILPVLGTCLVLFSQRYTSHITGNRIFQRMGLWSYSIYLWHWPVVVLGQFFDVPYWTFFGLIVSVILGWLSYTFVEKKDIFSYSIFFITNKLTAPIVTISLCVVIVGAYVSGKHYSKLYPEKVKPYIMGLHFYENGIQRYPDKGKVVHINKANDNTPSYLMIGDSNAAHYAYGMAEVDDRHYLLSWISSCLNFPDYTTKPYAQWMNKKWLKQCQNNYKTLYDYDELDVILAQHWYKKNGVICVSEECSFNLSLVTYNDFLLNQLEKLVSIVGTNRNLYIVGFVPAPANSVVTCMKKIFNSDCERKSSAFSPERIEINRLLENFSTRFSNVHFIDPFQAVCNDQPVCTTVINDKNLFFDEGHLSQFGSQVMWEYIASELP